MGAPAILPGYRPTFAQQRIHESAARIKVISGGIRSGKTINGCANAVYRILGDVDSGKGHPLYAGGPFRKRMRPLLLYWVIAPVHALLKEAITYITDAFPVSMREAWLENEATLFIRTARGYVAIEFKSAEEPERLVSRAVNGVFIDEGARCSAETWPIVRGRLTDFRGWATVATSPMNGRGSWVYKDLISRAADDPDIEVFELKTIDNPIIDLAEVRRAKEQMPERFFRRDYLADWASWGSAVYPEFDPAVHRVSEKRLTMELGYAGSKLVDIRSTFRQVVISIDWGFSAPACLLVLAQTASSEWICVDEFYESGLVVSDPDPNRRTLVQEAWRLKNKWAGHQVHCDFVADTEDAQARAQFTNSGLHTHAAHKSHTHGARKVSTLLHVNTKTGRPRLRILETCRQTLDTVPRLSWALDKNGDAIEGTFASGVPLHAADALRYGAEFITRHEDDGLPKAAPVRRYSALG